MINSILKECKDKMTKAFEFVLHDFGTIIAGRANLAVLDGVKISYYSSMVPLSQVASLSLGDSVTMLIEPWDKSIIKDIEKAIDQANLRLTPSNDGNVIRIKVPALTQERRQEILKVVKKKSEDGKIVIRNLRREFNEKLKKLEKNSEITEDDSKKSMADIQKYTDDFVKKIEDSYKIKEKDILEI